MALWTCGDKGNENGCDVNFEFELKDLNCLMSKYQLLLNVFVDLRSCSSLQMALEVKCHASLASKSVSAIKKHIVQ